MECSLLCGFCVHSFIYESKLKNKIQPERFWLGRMRHNFIWTENVSNSHMLFLSVRRPWCCCPVPFSFVRFGMHLLIITSAVNCVLFGNRANFLILLFCGIFYGKSPSWMLSSYILAFSSSLYLFLSLPLSLRHWVDDLLMAEILPFATIRVLPDVRTALPKFG